MLKSGKMKGESRRSRQAIIKSLGELQGGYAGGDLNATHLDACMNPRDNYDNKFGGFGKHPKFPTCHTLASASLLSRLEKKMLAMVHILKSIRLGGIYDQIGYGVHRYATDEKWLVPHLKRCSMIRLFYHCTTWMLFIARTSSTTQLPKHPWICLPSTHLK